VSKEKRDAATLNRLLQNARTAFARLIQNVRAFFKRSLSTLTAVIALLFALVAGLFKTLFSNVFRKENISSHKTKPVKAKGAVETPKASTKIAGSSIKKSGFTKSIQISFYRFTSSIIELFNKLLKALGNDIRTLGAGFISFSRSFQHSVTTWIHAVPRSSFVQSSKKSFSHIAVQSKRFGGLLLSDLKVAFTYVSKQIDKAVTVLKSKKTQDSLKAIVEGISKSLKTVWIYVVDAGKFAHSILWSPSVRDRLARLGAFLENSGRSLWKWISDPDFHKRIPRMVVIIIVVILVYWMLFGFPASRSNMIVDSIDPAITAEAVRLELATRSLNAQILSGVAIFALSFWFISFIMKEMNGNKGADK
jgi:hypothetical protein